jgi:hypothetical protein
MSDERRWTGKALKVGDRAQRSRAVTARDIELGLGND